MAPRRYRPSLRCRGMCAPPGTSSGLVPLWGETTGYEPSELERQRGRHTLGPSRVRFRVQGQVRTYSVGERRRQHERDLVQGLGFGV